MRGERLVTAVRGGWRVAARLPALQRAVAAAGEDDRAGVARAPRDGQALSRLRMRFEHADGGGLFEAPDHEPAIGRGSDHDVGAGRQQERHIVLICTAATM